MKRLLTLLLFASACYGQTVDTVLSTDTPNAGRVKWNNNDINIRSAFVDSTTAHRARINAAFDTLTAHLARFGVDEAAVTAYQTINNTRYSRTSDSLLTIYSELAAKASPTFTGTARFDSVHAKKIHVGDSSTVLGLHGLLIGDDNKISPNGRGDFSALDRTWIWNNRPYVLYVLGPIRTDDNIHVPNGDIMVNDGGIYIGSDSNVTITASNIYIGGDSVALAGAIDTATARTYSNSLYAVYLSGAGIPTTQGKNGDLYWDTTNLYLWRKVADVWRQEP